MGFDGIGMMKMRVLAGSDFHYPKRVQGLDLIRQGICVDADVLILAGDMVQHYDPVLITDLLGAVSDFQGPKLFVSGNHELWSKERNTRELYEEELPTLVRSAGFHPLEMDGPFFHEDVAFVGTLGWYDYKFALRDSSPPGVLVALEHRAGKVVLKKTNRMLEDVSDAEYATKEVAWYEGNALRSAKWSDKDYIDWECTDQERLHTLLDRFRKDLEEAHEKANRVIVVSHMVPHEEGLHSSDNLWRGWIRSYMGSPEIGALIEQFSKVKGVVFGHCHRGASYQKDNLQAWNVASPRGKWTSFDVP